MTCSLCPRVAWYLAGKKGFCGEHRDEAYAAMAKVQRETQSAIGTYQFLANKVLGSNFASGGSAKRTYHNESDSPLSVSQRLMASKVRNQELRRAQEKASRSPQAAR